MTKIELSKPVAVSAETDRSRDPLRNFAFRLTADFRQAEKSWGNAARLFAVSPFLRKKRKKWRKWHKVRHIFPIFGPNSKIIKSILGSAGFSDLIAVILIIVRTLTTT